MNAFPIKEWNEELGPMDESSIRKLHTPAECYRVSTYSYAPGATFRGAMRPGLCYILQGSCRYDFGFKILLRKGQVARLPGGEYDFAALGDDGVVVTLVWELPFDRTRTG
jgi:hypothetical protein